MAIWKPVVGYEGLYEVSSDGQVRSLETQAWNGHRWHTKKGRVLRQHPASPPAMPYLSVTLSKQGKVKTFRVHNLVARAFLGEKPEGYQVGHLDADPSNNRADNLRYMTAAENLEQSRKDNPDKRNGPEIRFKGKSLRKWSLELGSTNGNLVGDRLRRGWPIEMAVTIPVQHHLSGHTSKATPRNNL